MIYIVQCPECGERELENKVNLEQFYCPDCDKNFDYELMHFVKINNTNIMENDIKTKEE